MIETISGIVTAVVIIVVAVILSRYFTIKLIAATILVAIAFIYVGFSLKGNPVGIIVMEICVSLIFYFLAIIGYTKRSVLIAYGIILHGVWDILHHSGWILKTDIPVYWPSFCITVDIIDGLFFLCILTLYKDNKFVFRKA